MGVCVSESGMCSPVKQKIIINVPVNPLDFKCIRECESNPPVLQGRVVIQFLLEDEERRKTSNAS